MHSFVSRVMNRGMLLCMPLHHASPFPKNDKHLCWLPSNNCCDGETSDIYESMNVATDRFAQLIAKKTLLTSKHLKANPQKHDHGCSGSVDCYERDFEEYREDAW